MQNDIPKNVDGISRLDKNDIRKSRELVLNSIGEEASEPISSVQKPILEKKDRPVDSIFLATKNNIVAPAKEDPLPVAESPDVAPEPDVLLPPKLEEPVLEKIVPEIGPVVPKKARREVKKKDKENTKKKAVPNRKKIDTKESVSRQKEPRKKPIRRPKNPLEPKKSSAKRGGKQKEKFMIRFSRSISGLKLTILATIKKAFGMFIFLVSTFLLVYSVLALLILNFGQKSSLISAVSAKITIPALISADGIVDYEKYLRLQDISQLDAESKEDFYRQAAKLFILEKLFKKHQVDNINDLRELLPFDEEVNVAPLNRIRKIKSSIITQDDFVKNAKKFGDVGQANIKINEFNDYDFGPYLGAIQKGETSDVIITKKGYYIVHCFDRKDAELVLSYVFIPGNTLEEFLADKSADYKFWNLAK